MLEQLDHEQFEHSRTHAEDGPAHWFRMLKGLTLFGYFTSVALYARVLVAVGDHRAAADAAATSQIAPDGSIWTLVDGDLVRTISTETQRVRVGAPSATFALVGNEPFALLLPDVLVQNKPGCLKQMIDAYNAAGQSANIIAVDICDQIASVP